MGKASELDDWLDKQPPLTQEETDERRGGKRPELRLRPDVLSQALDPGAPVSDVLDRLGNETANGVAALHDADSGATAIAVPLAQYLRLVSAYIGDNQLLEAQLDGRIVPPDATLEASGVYQADPQATWIDTGPLA